MCQFAVTEIVDLVYWTCFNGIQQMKMKDELSIDKSNPTFISLTATAIHHCLFAQTTAQVRVPPQFHQGDGAQCQWNMRNINHTINNS
jgi:hypothetical protein